MIKTGVEPLLQSHRGVYAVIIRDENVLLVKKSRGPYTGTLDLVGGRAEEGESDDKALRRELREEIGAEMTWAGPWNDFDLHVDKASDGRAISFHHFGRWRLAEVSHTAWTGPKEDVEEFLWIPLKKLHDYHLSELAKATLSQYLP